jgi:hypothetical protein
MARLPPIGDERFQNCVCGRVSAGSRVSLPASVGWRAKFIAVAKAFSSPSIVTNGQVFTFESKKLPYQQYSQMAVIM